MSLEIEIKIPIRNTRKRNQEIQASLRMAYIAFGREGFQTTESAHRRSYPTDRNQEIQANLRRTYLMYLRENKGTF